MARKFKAPMAYIYGLKAPQGRQFRYIGCTVNPTQRKANHVRHPLERMRGNKELLAWLRQFGEMNRKVRFVILKKCRFEHSGKWEAFFINKCRRVGARLLNKVTPDKFRKRKERIDIGAKWLKHIPTGRIFLSQAAASRATGSAVYFSLKRKEGIWKEIHDLP